MILPFPFPSLPFLSPSSFSPTRPLEVVPLNPARGSGGTGERNNFSDLPHRYGSRPGMISSRTQKCRHHTGIQAYRVTSSHAVNKKAQLSFTNPTQYAVLAKINVTILLRLFSGMLSDFRPIEPPYFYTVVVVQLKKRHPFGPFYFSNNPIEP